MKIKKKFNRVSIAEVAVTTLTSLVLLNGLIYLIFTVLLKMPFDQLFEKIWTILLLIPLSHGIIQSSTNRNGVLTIKSSNKTDIVLSRIEESLNQKEYQIIQKNNGQSIYEYKTTRKKLSNLHKGNVVLNSDEGFIEVLGKRDILNPLEKELRKLKRLSKDE